MSHHKPHQMGGRGSVGCAVCNLKLLYQLRPHKTCIPWVTGTLHWSTRQITTSWGAESQLKVSTLPRRPRSESHIGCFTQDTRALMGGKGNFCHLSKLLPTNPTWMALFWVLPYSWRSFIRHPLPKLSVCLDKSIRVLLLRKVSCYRVQRKRNNKTNTLVLHLFIYCDTSNSCASLADVTVSFF